MQQRRWGKKYFHTYVQKNHSILLQPLFRRTKHFHGRLLQLWKPFLLSTLFSPQTMRQLLLFLAFFWWGILFAIGSGGPGHHMKRERDRERERASFYCTAYAHAYKNISVQGGERSPIFLFYFLFLFPRDSTPHRSHAARTKAVRPSSAEGGDTKAALRSVQSRDLFPCASSSLLLSIEKCQWWWWWESWSTYRYNLFSLSPHIPSIGCTQKEYDEEYNSNQALTFVIGPPPSPCPCPMCILSRAKRRRKGEGTFGTFSCPSLCPHFFLDHRSRICHAISLFRRAWNLMEVAKKERRGPPSILGWNFARDNFSRDFTSPKSAFSTLSKSMPIISSFFPPPLSFPPFLARDQ